MNKDTNFPQRLCIYVTYNKEHKFKEYMSYMLKALKECCSKLCVVCNYQELFGGEEYLHPYADAVFYRENRGYDAGAYKDALCTLLGWDTIYEYDELILVNDSFFGPFYNLSGYFNLMEDVNCDFWGMTRHPSGEFKEIELKFESHVQSYFLVFRSRVLKSHQYKEFWENFIYPNTYLETVTNFEIGINKYLRENGFVSLALTDVWGLKFKYNENPTFYYSLDLIKDNGLPILKKKTLLISDKRFRNALQAVEFLERNDLYSVSCIWELIDSQFYIENYALVMENSLEVFCRKYSKIFIYGAGVCGKNMSLYLDRKGWKHEGIIVTDVAGQDLMCTAFKDVSVDLETGIIVSVISRKASREIAQYVSSKCSSEQLFFLSDCVALASDD